ncbi:hypothetical protein [Haloarcula pellucida]|nr:hypothetical protein [Halomicroarcula pellucida]MBX0350321.1 hypothetical protein [Halomicroarcula pellucida]
MRRRDLLAACGVGLTGLAGCSSMPWTNEDEGPDVDTAALAADLDPVAFPATPFPSDTLEACVTRHRERAETLLDRVPSDPSIPNEAVRQELDHVRPDPEERPPESLPDGEWALDWLDDWQDYRADAATAEAAYRAATGTDDAGALATRRREIRGTIGDLWATQAYRAPDPLTAAVVHAPLEDMVDTARRLVQPRETYPSDPVAAPFRAGEVVHSVERADAVVADARRIRDAIVDGDTSPHAGALGTATQRLRWSLSETANGLHPYVEEGEEAFGRELSGADRALVTESTRPFRYLWEEVRELHDDDQYALAVVETGRALVAAEVLRAIVTGVRNREYPEEVTASLVRQAAADARTAVRGVLDQSQSPLTVALLHPALDRQRGTVREMAEGYHDGADAYAAFTRIAMYARGVPEATTFVAARLDEASEDGDG